MFGAGMNKRDRRGAGLFHSGPKGPDEEPKKVNLSNVDMLAPKVPVLEAQPQPEPQHGSKITPMMAALREPIFNALLEVIDLTKLAKLNKDKARADIAGIITEIVAIKNMRLSTAEQLALAKDISDDLLGFGPLEPLLARDDIGDIMVNGAGRVFIDAGGLIHETPIRFRDDAHLTSICQRMAAETGRHVDQASPICDARLSDGSRINIILPPLSTKGPILTIRKFKKDKLVLRDLVNYDAISPAGARILAIIAASRCNVLISGGTGSGKTTLLNCLTGFFGQRERIVTCEDTAELQLQQPHVVSLETRPANTEGVGEITMRDLVRNCLRMRPERIIVGEVRGGEAIDLLQAMNTGHDGSMGTIHANTPRDALGRLETLVAMTGHGLAPSVVRQMISSSIDIIIQTIRLRDGSRKITHITEVMHTDGDVIITQDLLNFRQTGETPLGRIIGEHVSSGISRPRFLTRAQDFGLSERLVDALIEAGAPPYATTEDDESGVDVHEKTQARMKAGARPTIVKAA